MSENTKIWDILGRTDPKHTKPFKRAGGFSGTAIKPMFSYRMMTEQFGPCGDGWGVNEPKFEVVPGPEGEVLVFCTASIWYTFEPGERQRTVYGVGGDKVVGKNKYGLSTDDEAFKKAFTDAITNALKLIGVGADVHMGMFDDNKYVNTMEREFAEPAPKPTSAAQMKRGLGEIEKDLVDCNSMAAFKVLGENWKRTMESENWSQDYRDEAHAKFKAKLADIKADAEKDAA